ncbi:FAD-binding monooxygenase [Pseudarthrobacter sp. J75]|uniref:FAD-binding monooxygenase n=1 Tax=unclassified Pseudarthrobacter TaxID=2647000 RepID=UPI002E81D976|nr:MULTISPECIES: FAD-binding monooxygenase [unclassified Pseudarthrobacter]MEE2522450.1 FAD-binding monooxygenase [Pseudarthrobacter sp. J47]MEE2529219.1 FAD-binding monooxygenase [Pseudarthrobacter sp. J75]
MQFHRFGYESGDPRVRPAAGTGINRRAGIPDTVDVLIVGTGPAGMLAAAQLAQFPGVTTRIVERRPGRLAIGRADGIQCRTVETFQAFGFAERIIAEAYHIEETAFWKPDPADSSRIIRSARTPDDATGMSEFPHLVVNQARVLDYFAEAMANSPARMQPDYGLEFQGLELADEGDYPVTVTLRHTAGPRGGEDRVVRAKYVIGADGARSKVRESIGCTLSGDQANHAWGVMDVLAETNFPDVRLKCAIQSGSGGSILLIPREGGHLFRMYVDLGEVDPNDHGAVRNTSLEEIIHKGQEILRPYTLEVRDVAWHSVYEVGHRLTDRFDDVLPDQRGQRTPRIFIAGDACHTHSAKAGQGMNVSMQDGFNLAWKLGHVLEGRSPESLLTTYSEERQVVAQNLIDFDKQWSSMMAKKPEEFASPSELEDFYVSTAEFPAGFMTQYAPSILTAESAYQHLATGFPLGKRFKSAPVRRVADANRVHLGHHASADGRWRIYVFADAAAPGSGAPSAGADFAEWMETASDSPLAATPSGADPDAWFDVKVIYQQHYADIDINVVPAVYRPQVGPFRLTDYEKVYAADSSADIFELRGLSRDGVVVVVRPDQYVANVLPLTATAELSAYFDSLLLRSGTRQQSRG